jgi:hypothetical protein
MNESGVKKIHWSFWVVTISMLIWNIMGCVNFFVQMNPEMISSYRENEQAIIQGRPLWATMGFAVAVFGGAIGCVILLLNKSTAVYLFIASLLGVLLATAHTLGVGIEFGPGEIFGIVLMPTIVAVFLIWYSLYAKNKGWVST